MFGLFKKDPLKKLKREHKLKSERALEVGRGKHGDLKLYATLMTELKELEDQIAELSNKSE